MRLRVSLEIRISKRKNKGHPQRQNAAPEPPHVADGPEALVELAGPQHVGFTIDMPNHDPHY